MDTLDAFILGIVQGLAEYLPISSSGHLEIFRDILGLELNGSESLQFDIILHVATVLSTIVVLWNRFVPLCGALFRWRSSTPEFSYVWKLILSAVPIGIVGFCFKDFIEGFFGTNLTIVGICLCVTAALLCFAYFFRTNPLMTKKAKGEKHYEPRDISWKDAIVIGLSQAIAVLPGLSRSGTTIATGILIGDKREDVARFSFFMVIIPIMGEAFLDCLKLASGKEIADGAIGFAPLFVGFITSFVVGCLACRWMLDIVAKGKLVWFALYCVCVGVLCICW